MGGKERDARPAAASAVEEDPNAVVVCSSPPCFMHELDPAYLGYLGREEVSALLAGLLAADWGGAVPHEERLRAALRRHLRAPEAAHGAPAAEPVRRGPDRLARTIREALPRVHDDALRRDLEDVADGLERGGGPPQGGAPRG
jgi:hypothetical protein